jgi:hypothetical protein
MVVVASGAPGTPVACCATAGYIATARAKIPATALIFMDAFLNNGLTTRALLHRARGGEHLGAQLAAVPA